MKKLVGAALGLLLAAGAANGAWAKGPQAAQGDYRFLGDTELGGPGFWDYLAYDPAGKRIYAAHVDHISVVDAASGKEIGTVGPLHDAHGVAVVPALGKGYADSGEDGVLKVFSTADFHVIKEIKVDKDADGVIFDAATQSILVVSGDGKSLTIVSTRDDTVTQTVALPGKPEFLAVDGAGHAFINIADKASIARVDLKAGKVVAEWPLAGCESPQGIAYDARTDRLFSGCANSVMVVVDGATGKSLARLPIGGYSDAIVVDEVRHRAFSANGDGTLTVVSENGKDGFAVLRTVPTFFGGRNMAIDPTTGKLFIAHGNMTIASPMTDLLQLRFAWNGLNIATFSPNN